MRPVKQVRDTRVLGVVGAEHRYRLGGAIGLPDVFDVEDGEHHAFRVAKGKP